MISLFVLSATTSLSSADQRMERIASLYADICLKAFPSDRAVESALIVRDAKELSPEVVRVTLRDDPGRAWYLKDEDVTVWLELPPFHACSVRWNAGAEGTSQFYQAALANFKSRVGDFTAIPKQVGDRGDIHIEGSGESRVRPDQSAESLFFIVQSINDPKRRAAGETGFSLRYVHQIAPPPGQAAK